MSDDLVKYVPVKYRIPLKDVQVRLDGAWHYYNKYEPKDNDTAGMYGHHSGLWPISNDKDCVIRYYAGTFKQATLQARIYACRIGGTKIYIIP